MCVWVCVYVSVVEWNPEGSIGSPGAGVTEGCEKPHGCWESSQAPCKNSECSKISAGLIFIFNIPPSVYVPVHVGLCACRPKEPFLQPQFGSFKGEPIRESYSCILISDIYC